MNDAISQHLTRSQEQIWLAHQLAQEPAALGVPAILDIAGAVDASALSRAFQALVDGTEVLRTIVVSDRGTPKAMVLRHIDAPVDIVRAEGEPDGFLKRWLATRVQRPFRLDECLFDAALVVLSERRSVWYLNQHHLITDGWSVHLAHEHLRRLYEGIINGEPPRVPAARRFSEYVDWCNGDETAAERQAAADFWNAKLAAHIPAPALYGRSPRPDGRTAFQLSHRFGSDRSSSIYSAASTIATNDRSMDRAVVAFFATCLAAYQVRVSGASVVAIGIPYRSRPAAFEQTLGPFATVVPLILPMDSSESFATLLETVQRELDDALKHGRHPVAHSRAHRAYHALLNFRAEGARTFAGAPASLRFVFPGRADEPLSLHINRTPGTRELAVDFVFGDDVFDRERGERSIEHFLAMVDACLADPKQPISNPSLVTDVERARLFAWSRSTHNGASPAASCTDLIETVARERPQALAAVDGAQHLTYSDFAMSARALASRLRERGVGAETPVGIAMDRTLATYTAILGVLLAGGAYVPLDPRLPDARLKQMVEDAHVRLLITDDVHESRMAAIGDLPAQVITLEKVAKEPAGGPLPAREPDQLAYVIFTSGSTGRAKAVAITDRAMVNHSLACRRIFGLTERDRVLQFRTLTFDASIEEVFPAWTTGATLVVGHQALTSDLDEFTTFVEAERITVMDLPTAFWHAWVRALAASGRSVSPALRLVAVGGEQASSALLRKWSRHARTGVRWVNMYGPTETCVTALSYEASTFCEDPVPIGSPIDNASAFILDSNRRLVPIGVPGGLYIGGVGVARGYINRPDLTSKQFVASPFDAGERLYVTGDIARFRDDGQIEYLGRADDQLKIRGYRVDPAEIEHVLAEHPDVHQAVVLPRTYLDDQTQLAAYVVAAGELTDSDLRGFARRGLPEYMVPSAFVRLERLPLTAHGKIDKEALAAVPPLAAGPAAGKASARNLVEAQLIALWEELLDVPGVGVDDSFLDLGGHSLLGARMLYEISERFGRKLPFSVLFPDVTVEKLAAELQQAAPGDPAASPVQSLHVDGAGPPLIFFHGDYGTGGLYATRLARLLGPDQPLVVVHPHGADGRTVPATIEEMADDRLADILAVRPDGPFIVGGYCNGALVAYETALRLSRMGHDVVATILIDAAIRTTGSRALWRGVQRYAMYRDLTTRDARDRFLAWRDRQATMKQLLDLTDSSRFRGIVHRVSFVARSVARNLAGARRPQTSERKTPASGALTQDDLWAGYVAAMDAYVPPVTSGRVVLLLSDDLLSRGADRGWRRVARNLEVRRLEGRHYECVTENLATVAMTLGSITDH